MSAEYEGSHGFSMLTQLDGCYLPDEQQARGRVATQRFSYQHRWLTLHLGLSYYHTDNYASRVYLYENAPLSMARGSAGGSWHGPPSAGA